MSRSRSLKSIVLCGVVAFTSMACSTTSPSNYQTFEIHASEVLGAHGFERVPIRSGQLIVSSAGTSASFMMSLMVDEYTPYAHAGILVKENEEVFVYDAFANLGLRFWDPPTKRMNGSIRRIELSRFLQSVTAARIYEHKSLEMEDIAEFARSAFARRIPFDGMFDYRTPDALYCAEFVARALEVGGYQNGRRTPRTRNASMNRAMAWLEVTAPEFILTSGLLHEATLIATFSRRYSTAQLAASAAFDAGLHNRFSAEQVLGNVMLWTATGPRLRPHLAKLREQVIRDAGQVEDPKVWVTQKLKSELRVPLPGS